MKYDGGIIMLWYYFPTSQTEGLFRVHSLKQNTEEEENLLEAKKKILEPGVEVNFFRMKTKHIARATNGMIWKKNIFMS